MTGCSCDPSQNWPPMGGEQETVYREQVLPYANSLKMRIKMLSLNINMLYSLIVNTILIDLMVHVDNKIPFTQK